MQTALLSTELVDGAAGFLNLCSRALREAMRRNPQRLFQLAGAQHHHVMLCLLNNTSVMQQLGCYFFVGLKIPIKSRKTYFQPTLLENVGEPTLGQATMQRHLAAFKSNLGRVAGARFLPLLAAPCGFAQPRAGAAPHALLLMCRTFRWMQVVKTECHYSLQDKTPISLIQ